MTETLVRYVPDWFPGANFQRQAKSWRVPVMGMLNKPYAYYHKRVVSLSISE